ncbi:MAG: HD-GYP domain-containing protein, partial [Candidatus Omnitrophica bacterium]|nr:HD-GYP domain-containing protein [Candidatus Omnitrophota bacterium]
MPAAWLAVGALLAGWAGALWYARGLSHRLAGRSRELEEIKAQMLEWNRQLEEKVSSRAKELERAHLQLQNAYLEMVTSLVEAMTAKDTYLYAHSHSVACYARALAEELGLPRERINRLTCGCELHDLGKIAVPDSILMKPGPLTKEEFDIIKQHPVWGARILEPLTFMKDITEMVHEEHERWDGTGYPRGLRGEQIRLEARIIAVADALDAMTSKRPYRQPFTLEKACEEIHRNSGT